MWTQLFDWAFHWILLYIAFELGKRWNEKDVAASIAAITESQSKRRSDEFLETPEKVMERRMSRGSPVSPSVKEKRRLSKPISSVLAGSDPNAELRPLITADMCTPPKVSAKHELTEVVVKAYLPKIDTTVIDTKEVIFEDSKSISQRI